MNTRHTVDDNSPSDVTLYASCCKSFVDLAAEFVISRTCGEWQATALHDHHRSMIDLNQGHVYYNDCINFLTTSSLCPDPDCGSGVLKAFIRKIFPATEGLDNDTLI